jgi:hypothetical protein
MKIECGGLPKDEQDRVDLFNAAIDCGDGAPEDRTELLADCRTAAAAAVTAQASVLAQIEDQTREGLIALGLGVESDARCHNDPEGAAKRFRERAGTSVKVTQARDELQRRQGVSDRVDAIQRGMTSYS